MPTDASSPDPRPAARPARSAGDWLAVPGVCLACVGLTLLVGQREVFGWLNGWSRPTGDAVWANLTTLGDGLVLAAVLLPFLGRRPRLVWSALLCAALVALTLSPVKRLANVRRPAAVLNADGLHVIGDPLRKRAFPSGHSATVFAFAGLLWVELARGRLRWGLLLLAGLVGASRVVVGAHWPIDVAVGALVGWLAAVSASRLADVWPVGQGRRVQLAIGVLLSLAGTIALVKWGPRMAAQPLPVGVAAVGLGFGGLAWRSFLRGTALPHAAGEAQS